VSYSNFGAILVCFPISIGIGLDNDILITSFYLQLANILHDQNAAGDSVV
jgi:hypothetical protein